MAQTEPEKVERQARLETSIESLEIQNIDSQGFAIKTLTELFLSPDFSASSDMMRYHLQVLKLNKNLLESLFEHKIGY